MKLFIPLLLIICIGCGCRKHAGKKECRITRIIKNGTQTYDLLYGSDGRLNSVLLLPDNESTIYSYEGKTMKVTVNKNGKFQYRMIIDNNASGFATTVLVEKNLSGSDWFKQEYKYEGNRLVNNTLSDVAKDTARVEYIWENGNATVSISDGDVLHHKYYTDKKFQPGDWRYIQQLLTGYRIYETKNLLQMSIVPSSNFTTYFTYQFDEEGHIVEAKSTSTLSTTIYKIAYECVED